MGLGRLLDFGMLATELSALFARDLTRLSQQIEAFPDTPSLWATSPGVTNGAGTLALHLEGNLREYVGRQLGAIPHRRDRPLEFSARGTDQRELLGRLGDLHEMVPQVIGALSPATLDARYPEDALGHPMSTRQFLIHLSGHLNYHLGQIDYLRRITTGQGALRLAAF